MNDAETHVDPAILEAYARGDLPPGRAKEVEVHVGRCASCRDRLTEGLGSGEEGATGSIAPPSVEVPETAEVRAVPSQVSVMHVPQTLDGGGTPSHTSVTTGIGPRRARSTPPRPRSAARLALTSLLAVALVVSALAAVYLLAIHPRTRSGQLTDRAGEALGPVLARVRLADLQHPSLRGTDVYRPGSDPALEQSLLDAEDALRRAVDANGANWEARNLLALSNLMHGQLREARTHYQEVEATVGPRPETHLGLGILDYLAADVANDPADREYALAQADLHFRELALDDAGYAEALYDRAVVALARGDAEEAARLLDAYRVIQPGSPWIAELEARFTEN